MSQSGRYGGTYAVSDLPIEYGEHQRSVDQRWNSNKTIITNNQIHHWALMRELNIVKKNYVNFYEKKFVPLHAEDWDDIQNKVKNKNQETW